MANGNSLVNLGELSKTATVLIEKVSDAVGGICKPWQMKRVAKAEVEVDKIRALGTIECSEIEQRAMHRLVAEETMKQENIENITAKAVKELKPDAKPENLEKDWVTNLFDKCRLVSDEEMQSLWSKVLAGEANESGSFSKRTVDFVASLDKKDAHLFTKLMGFTWNLVRAEVSPLIYDFQNNIYSNNEITFIMLNHLDSIGLIKFSSNSAFSMLQMPKGIGVMYYGTRITLEFQNEQNNGLEVGPVVLTQVGQELAPICGASSVPGFLDYVVKEWQKKGYIVSHI
jgi:hypothetical protein